MKNNFLKKMIVSASVLLASMSIISCSSDDNSKSQFTGENKIVLMPVSTLSLQDNSTDKIDVNVLLVSSMKEKVELEFKLTSNVVNGQVIAEIDNPKIVLEPGQKKAVLTISSKTRRALKNNAYIQLEIAKNDSQIKLEKSLEIVITPIAGLLDLTPAQKELIEGYKKHGLDLYTMIGELEVTGLIDFKGNEYLTPINSPAKIPVNGKTFITLSEKATADRPILKMVSNAMGIESYCYYLFRELTVNDKEFWTQQPAPQAIMELINLSSSSDESFSMSLDDIEIDLKTKEVKVIGKGKDTYDNPITIIPFQYEYTAWDRLQKLLKEANPIAIENFEQGGSVNPVQYLNSGSILEKDDQYNNNTWYKTETKLTDDKLAFQFIIDHYQASGFIKFNVEYKLINNYNTKIK